ncbi:hypothetical protein LDENG_00216590 [Lucifuga dentata]|nr:hypothetical protein LDENG_00216590 [Lucifuga dentata]
MDTADSDQEATSLMKAVASQGALLGQHELLLRTLSDSNQAMINQITQLTHQVALLTSQFVSSASAALPVQSALRAPPPASPQPRESYVPDPEPFTGELSKCRGFLLQCSLVFNQQPLTFPSDQSKLLGWRVACVSGVGRELVVPFLCSPPAHLIHLQREGLIPSQWLQSPLSRLALWRNPCSKAVLGCLLLSGSAELGQVNASTIGSWDIS